MWLLWSRRKDGAEYNTPAAVRIRQAVDLDALRQAFALLIERYPILRTTYHLEGGEPVQRVRTEFSLPLAVADGQGWSQERLDQHLLAEVSRPFDLEQGPVFRVSLIQLAPAESLLLLVFHHIAIDNWSLVLLMEELGAAYLALVASQAPELPPAPQPFSAHVAWQRELLAGPEGERQWQYWQERLQGELPDLDLPTDKPRPPLQSHAGDCRTFQLPRELTQGLRAVARQEGATLYTVVLAAFYVLLHRYSGQDDLLMLSPRFGRTQPGAESMLGYFTTPGVLRANLAGNPRFADFLRQVREVVVGHREHQEMPFPLLVERLQPRRDPGRSPIAQVAFTFQKSHRPGIQGLILSGWGHGGHRSNLNGLEVETYGLPCPVVKFDLEVVMEEIDGALCGSLIYRTDLWERATIDRMLAHYDVLLEGIVSDPGMAIGELPLLTAAERQQMLVDWNATAKPFADQSCLHEVLEAQVERSPDAIALTYGGVDLTYRELNRRANQLAHHLRAMGVGPEQIVGLSVERSPELVIGLLGIIKAGGAFLPLDPAYPRDRLAYILQDAEIDLVITQSHLLEALPLAESDRAIQVLQLDRDAEAIAAQPTENPALNAGPESLAYVIYTSGSTGRPKGTLLHHRGVCSLLAAQAETYRTTPDDRVLQFASFSFDASVFEITLALSAGARLYLGSREELMPGPGLVRFLRENKISMAVLSPTALSALPPADLPDLTCLTSAAEPLTPELIERWASGRRFLNAYGPTEATVWSTVLEVTPGTTRPTIGYPVANTQIYLLDRYGQPVPVGVAGEIYIGGPALARGYHNRPDLTAEKFVPHPFSADPAARLYRTGDLARYRPDGQIEYIGRIDHQVKIRGYRIELGEIQGVLAEHPAVAQCLVVARDTASGEKRLVAYIIPVDGATPDPAELRAHVKGRLPDFMVPAAFVHIERFPMTPNGKVDLRALPDPQSWRASEFAAPERELERGIAAIWQEVLSLERVGLDENFFEIGGHSLAVVRVESLLQERLGLTVPTVELFRHPTIRSLAAFLGGAVADQPAQPQSRPRSATAPAADEAIAIIGMAGRFPGARSVDELWANLLAGVELVRELTEAEMLAAGVDPAQLADPRYVRREGVLDGIDRFDAAFFQVSPREAELMDPQQRLFLETAWEALEHASYANREVAPNRIGLYAGSGANHYLLYHIASNPALLAQRGAFLTTLLNEKDFLATRAAYKLDLTGPAYTLQTACSTSLVAAHVACQALLSGECDMALAGGVSLNIPQAAGYLYQEGHILSPDGHCRAFDADAKGTVRGSGAAILVLKRLADAQRDGDFIWAVIKSSAINNDGGMKVGYTAPSQDGQAQVIAAALERAGVDPRSIGYVEAHGTGTPLGDPIEIAALTQAYRSYTVDTGYCAIGSVKTNLGHLDAAAGAAGLIKAALALHHKRIPASLHFKAPNPKLNLAQTPFYVSAETHDWPAGDGPRRAAISSFGMGGTNAHMILEEAPSMAMETGERRFQLLTLSAATPSALEAMTDRLAGHLATLAPERLADAAYSLQVGRAPLAHRRILVCDSPADGAAALTRRDGARLLTGAPKPGAAREVVFLFPGQGAQYVQMGAGLYQSEPIFRAAVDRCAEILQPELGFDLRTLLYPTENEEQAGRRLSETAITQPALFVIEYALACLWQAWGVRPAAMLGHSIGEYVAACLAGVISLEDGLRLVAARGRLIQGLPRGSMLAVELPAAELQQHLDARLSLAAVNGPRLAVAAGPDREISLLHERLAAAGVSCRRLHTSHAFHSAMLDPILGAFGDLVRSIDLNPPQLPYLSNVTGDWITAAEATDPEYWVRHLRGTVRFEEGVARLLVEPDRLFLEVGPGNVLTSLLLRHPGRTAGQPALPSLRHPKEAVADEAFLLTTLGRLWLSGLRIDWLAVHSGERRSRIPLPTYPFEPKRFWIERGRLAESSAPASEVQVAEGEEALHPPAHAGQRPARDQVEAAVLAVYEEVLGIRPIGVDQRFFDLGGDSLSALSVMARLEQVLGQRLPVASLLESQTAENLAARFRQEEGQSDSLLVPIRTAGSLPPLFCIHPYGGHVSGYFQLAQLLGAEQPVYGIRARGMNGEATPITSIEAMATEYVEVIKAVQPDGPYYLVGHSMGGNIAWEMTAQLTAAGEEVALLAMLDTKAGNLSTEPLYRSSVYANDFVPDWLSDEAAILPILFPGLREFWVDLAEVAPTEQLGQLIQLGKAKGLLPEAIDPVEIDQLLAVAKANDIALRTHEPKPYAGPVLLLYGAEGFKVVFGEEFLGWEELATGDFALEEVPGNHNSLVEPPQVKILAERLRAGLNQARQSKRLTTVR